MENENIIIKKLPLTRPRKSLLKEFDPFYNSPLKPLPTTTNVESTSDADADKENINKPRQVFGELASIAEDDQPMHVHAPPREEVQTDQHKNHEYLLCMKEYEQFIKELLERNDKLETEVRNTKKLYTDTYEKYIKCKEILENLLISESAMPKELRETYESL